MKHRSIKLTTAAVAVAALTTGLLAGCSTEDGGSEGGAQTLRVTLANHVWTDIVKGKISEFEAANAVVLPVSADTPMAAGQFGRSLNLPFRMLSDFPEHQAAKACNAFNEARRRGFWTPRSNSAFALLEEQK